MISRNCLRQCRAVARRITLVSPAPVRLLGPYGLSRQTAQTFASVPDANNKTRESVDTLEEKDHASPFKQQRRTDLGKDMESESPLYPQSYPRIKPSEDRMAVPEFLATKDDGASSHLINLVGRVRAKRVVGKHLVFLDIVNEFQKVQIMVNKKNCFQPSDNVCTHNTKKFQLFVSLVQVGDHICRPIPLRLPILGRPC